MRAGTLHRSIPAQEHGTAKVVHDTPSEFERFQAARHGMPLYAQTYTRLFIDNTLWMTDAEFECATNLKITQRAYGDILIAGLGIGLIIRPLLDCPDVTSITVVERSADVIALIGPHYQDSKLTIIEADIYQWEPPKKAYNIIYFDVWANVPNEDNKPEISVLKKRYRSALKQGGRSYAWCEERTRR